MATADPISDLGSPSVRVATDLLVMVAAMPAEQLEVVLANLAEVFSGEGLLVATQDEFATKEHSGLRLIAAPPVASTWSLTAAGFVHAHQLAEEHEARGILMLGPGAESLNTDGLRKLAGAVLTASIDLAVPRYVLPPHAGMINSAIIYPLTRALFASRVRFPLAIDLGLSARMAERLAMVAQRVSAADQAEALLWPVDEAAAAGFTVDEYEVGHRSLPQPADPDINAILARVTGSLFSDIEAKAAVWQRARRSPPARRAAPDIAPDDGAGEVSRLVEAYRLAYTNLLEIWSLVLPPQTLVGLKRLSTSEPSQFHMPDSLWARIVFDFLIAYRLRTMNRGHLLGALIPLYLAWVAGHINLTTAGTSSEAHVEAVAAAFEADKPYLVSRWRWPDRFNS